MEQQAKTLAYLVIAFGLQPSEARNLNRYEIDALNAAGKEAGLIK